MDVMLAKKYADMTKSVVMEELLTILYLCLSSNDELRIS